MNGYTKGALSHWLTARGATVLAAAAIVALGACNKGGGEAEAASRAQEAVTVGPENIAIAENGAIQVGPAISGSLAPEVEATVRAEVSGAVLQTYVEKGQRVSRGQVLARLDDAALRDSYLSARSGVRTAEQAEVVARRNAERSTSLAAAGAVAERDLEQARWNVMSAESQLADARARFTQAEKLLAKSQVRAPFAGVVSERQVSAGDVVQPGGELFTVVDPSSMRLEGSVSSEALSSVRPGAPVEFTVTGYPGRVITGRVERVNPVADPATRQVRVYVQIPNNEGTLVGGLFAEGRVATETRTGILVPASAVDERGLAPSVRRVRGGSVEHVAVQLGLKDSATERVEIRSGLTAGDTVLVGSAQGMSAGTRIKVSEPADRASTPSQ